MNQPLGRRQALLRLAAAAIPPLSSYWYFNAQTRRLRNEERHRRLETSLALIAAQGDTTPDYRVGTLDWMTSVSNQIERKTDRVHVVTDVSMYSYQIAANFATKGQEVCYIRYAVEILKGGVSVTVLDSKGVNLDSRPYFTPGKYEDDLRIDVNRNPFLTVLVANNVSPNDRSIFDLLQCDVFLSSAGPNGLPV